MSGAGDPVSSAGEPVSGAGEPVSGAGEREVEHAHRAALLEGWGSDLRAVLPWWVAARLAVAACAAAVWLAGRADLLNHDERTVQLSHGLFSWDGAWYRHLATSGYRSVAAEGIRFFPLFPYAGRALGVLLGGRPGAGVAVLANVAALVAAVALRRLTRRELGDGALTRGGLDGFFAFYPAAFVLVLAYSEALYLCAAIGCFAAMRRRRFGWAAVAGFAAAMARPLGVLLVPALVIEVARAAAPSDAASRAGGWARRVAARWVGLGRVRWVGVAAVAAPVAGLVVVGLNARREGFSLTAPVRSQGPLRGSTHEPLSRLAQALWHLVHLSDRWDGIHGLYGVALVAAAVLVLRWLPVSYGLYSALVVAASLAASNLNSLERYGLNAFPVLMVLAALVARHPRWRWPLLAVSAANFAIFTSFAFAFHYVP